MILSFPGHPLSSSPEDITAAQYQARGKASRFAVDHRWIEECSAAGRLLDYRPFLARFDLPAAIHIVTRPEIAVDALTDQREKLITEWGEENSTHIVTESVGSGEEMNGFEVDETLSAEMERPEQ